MHTLLQYQEDLNNGLKPSLLEFNQPTTNIPLTIYANKPVCTLEVKENKLYKNKKLYGEALDIFNLLKIKPSAKFFPAFIGFFSYEFSQYFNKPCKKSSPHFPDAFFRLYENGTLNHNSKYELNPYNNFQFNHEIYGLKDSYSFYNKIRKIKDLIKSGDVYQVNLSMPFKFIAHDHQMINIYHAMQKNNRSPFMGMMQNDDWWLLSGSPERLFSLQDRTIITRPIAGTKKREFNTEKENKNLTQLLNSSKENAEHAMLVDLMRNDLNIIADTNSVSVDEDRTIEFYSHVMHLVSQVSAKTSRNLHDIFASIFPGGTITGAPKSSVMKAIASLEEEPRAGYTGSLGYISGHGIDFNILIRSVFKHNNEAVINAGAGIVINSDPKKEWEEINKKAQAVIDILQNRSKTKPSRKTIINKAKPVTTAKPKHHEKHILFIENNDSFSFNIINLLKSLGANIVVANKFTATISRHSHVIIGPGPGNPKDMTHLSDIISSCVQLNKPTLGICLGHQAIAHYFGASIINTTLPIHGECHEIKHDSEGLFSNLHSPTHMTRYHSLAIAKLPANLKSTAHSKDNCVMAFEHLSLPIFGLQFHPESYLSQNGEKILDNFLQI